MSPEKIDATVFSNDAIELIRALNEEGARFLLVGGHAVIFYGVIRLTGDTDFFYELSPENIDRVFRALLRFWTGSIPGVAQPAELGVPGTILQFGLPPNRLDLINQIDGVTFQDAWETRTIAAIQTSTGPLDVAFIGLAMLRRNKQASARRKDLDDLDSLPQP